MMPEVLILIAAVACVGAGVGFHFNRSNAAFLGIAILSLIAFLYGIGQYVERDNAEARALGFADASQRRIAKDAGFDTFEKWKQSKLEPARMVPPKKEEPAVVQRLPAPEPTKLDAIAPPSTPPQQSGGQGGSMPAVYLSNITQKTTKQFVEVSATLSNRNDFAIKNVVVTCGDKSYASGDVSAVVDRVVRARSDLQVAGLRMGPINPTLPPSTCLIAKFDRAD